MLINLTIDTDKVLTRLKSWGIEVQGHEVKKKKKTVQKFSKPTAKMVEAYAKSIGYKTLKR